MPELPEVETYVRELAPLLLTRQIRDARVYWPRTIARPSVADFQRQMLGHQILAIRRRGKYMVITLSREIYLLVHLRMTGELRVVPQGEADGPHLRVRWGLDGGEELHYSDPRKFGRIWLTPHPESILEKLGPEPLGDDFSPAYLTARLARRQISIKVLLLDQSLVAGIGNIYADEALFAAGIDPRRPAHTLSQPQICDLWAGIRRVLAEAIALRGSSLQNYAPPDGVPGAFQEHHAVFRRNGLPCPRCGQTVQRTRLAQRSTHYCPHCQE